MGEILQAQKKGEREPKEIFEHYNRWNGPEEEQSTSDGMVYKG